MAFARTNREVEGGNMLDVSSQSRKLSAGKTHAIYFENSKIRKAPQTSILDTFASQRTAEIEENYKSRC
jgi:hypothetical protein